MTEGYIIVRKALKLASPFKENKGKVLTFIGNRNSISSNESKSVRSIENICLEPGKWRIKNCGI
jgi:hypothetical protein